MLDRIQESVYNYQNDFFKGAIDLLKFSIPFALAYLAWVFVRYGSTEGDKTLVILTGIFIFISVLTGVQVILRILSQWKLGWESRSFHYKVISKKAMDELTEGRPRRETIEELAQLSARLKEEASIGEELRNNIPRLVFLHLVSFSIAVIFTVMEYLKDAWVTLGLIGVVSLFFILVYVWEKGGSTVWKCIQKQWQSKEEP